MNKLLLAMGIGMLVLNPTRVFSQRKADIGLFGGTAYYMGDINPNRHFYRPSLSLGALYRYNLNPRYAIKAHGYYAQLSGNDLDFPGLLHPDRPVSPHSFSTSLIDAGIQLEFNFLPFSPGLGTIQYTPYLSAGFSGAMIVQSDVNAENLLSFPFGAGVKMNLSKRISTGFEWSFRKTISDRIDGLENPSGTSSFLHNNDWYSFLGIFITYKFFNFATGCPAYDD
jgi:hypothetical protein